MFDHFFLQQKKTLNGNYLKQIKLLVTPKNIKPVIGNGFLIQNGHKIQ